MVYKTILYTVNDRIATITLNRPDRLNAWTLRMSKEVRHAMFKAAEDEMVRVIIITGAGHAFCAGADMDELKVAVKKGLSALDDTERKSQIKVNGNEKIKNDFLKRYSYFPAIPKPVIAAINGPAVGIGLVHILFCDIRIASENARFSTTFARRGLIAEHGIAWILPKIVGFANAIELLFTGRMVDAEEALHIGLVHKVVPQDKLNEATIDLAIDLSTKVSPRSLKVIKRQLYYAQLQTLEEAIDMADKEMGLSLESEDFKEGIAHFLEKRAPIFTGK